MARHSVAIFNPRTKGAVGCPPGPFPAVFIAVEIKGEHGGRGALIKLGQTYVFAVLPKKPEDALKFKSAFILMPYPCCNSRACVGLFAYQLWQADGPLRFFFFALYCSQRGGPRERPVIIQFEEMFDYIQPVNSLPPMGIFFQRSLFLVTYKSFLFMFVWDARMAFVGFTLQTAAESIHSLKQPGHLLWEDSHDFSELNKAYIALSDMSFICGSQTAAIWIHLGIFF